METTADAASAWEKVVENVALVAPAPPDRYDNQGQAYPLTQEHVKALQDVKDAAGKWKRAAEKIATAFQYATTIAQAWRTAANIAVGIYAKMQTTAAADRQAWLKEADNAVSAAKALETDSAYSEAQAEANALKTDFNEAQTDFQACQGNVDSHEKAAAEKAVEAEPEQIAQKTPEKAVEATQEATQATAKQLEADAEQLREQERDNDSPAGPGM